MRLDAIIGQLQELAHESRMTDAEERRRIADAAARLAAADMTELLIGARQTRNRYFGSRLFSEPAWDMLLALHLAHYRDHAVSVSAAITFGDTAPTTGLRWLKQLEAEGLVERRRDAHDQRRQFVCLTAVGVEKLDGYIAAFSEWVSARASLRKL